MRTFRQVSMILGIRFNALQQGRQGCHGHCRPGSPGHGSAANPRFWVATAAAMTGAGRSCATSCGPGIALTTWGPNCESLAKMIAMHHDTPWCTMAPGIIFFSGLLLRYAWHRKMFCVALHHRRFRCIILAGRCHWYRMKWWIWCPAWWIPWACWRQGTLYHCITLYQLLSRGRH